MAKRRSKYFTPTHDDDAIEATSTFTPTTDTTAPDVETVDVGATSRVAEPSSLQPDEPPTGPTTPSPGSIAPHPLSIESAATGSGLGSGAEKMETGRGGPQPVAAALGPWTTIVETYRERPLAFIEDILLRQYPDFKIEPWQRRFLKAVGRGERRISVRAGHGVGKAQPWDEPVLTMRGWVESGKLRLGDQVVGGDGMPTTVVGIYPQGVRPVYRVTLDDGCSTRAVGEHLWFTTTRSNRKHGTPGKVRSTAEIAASLTFPNGPGLGLNHCLPRLGPVWHEALDLPLDPYLLGCWLGDGTAGNISGPASKRAPQLAAAVSAGLVAREFAGQAHCGRVSLLGVQPVLRSLGLAHCRSWEKFVPRPYLHGSIEQRSALLQGLLDTDGTVGRVNGNLSYTTTSHDLALHVGELVRSLGGVTRLSGPIRKTYRSQDGEKLTGRPAWFVSLALPPEIVPFRNQAKAERWRPTGHCNRTRTLNRFV